MRFTFANRPRTVMGLLALLAIAGSVTATAEKQMEGLTIAEIDERLQVRVLFLVSSEEAMCGGSGGAIADRGE